MSRNKYGALKSVVDGIKFDSKAEARRWGELQFLEQAGVLTELRRQVPFVLVPGVRIPGEAAARPAVRLFADFTYLENGVLIVEDVKSPVTARLPAFRLKQHLMATVHGLEIRITA